MNNIFQILFYSRQKKVNLMEKNLIYNRLTIINKNRNKSSAVSVVFFAAAMQIFQLSSRKNDTDIGKAGFY